ncbi:MAG: sigma-70 family RNA polymerase sigma factor [Deltaproteobacteria bacterium]|nr:sigma-70 family RNA polymerase sigma factor [Deltaproteobacteria bacterium]
MNPAQAQPIVNPLQGLESQLQALHEASFGWALACCGRNSTEAEEVLQSAYEKLLTGKARFDGRSLLKTWLFAVIRRTAAEHRRWARVRSLWTSKAGTSEAAPISSPESSAAKRERATALAEALEQLATRQREVLHLVFYQEMSISEAADVMGVALGTARLHYERGKQNLLDRLKEKGVTQP